MKHPWAALALCAVLAGCQERTEVDQPLDAEPVGAEPAVTQPAAPAASGAMLDPDQASVQELQSVPGIDAALADTLVARRPYTSMLAVDSVLAGRLSEQQRDSVYARVWKPIDPNTATDQEILLIPGVGDRMLHEFKEYRPWRSVEQFRREIGKYVDEQEIARLEQYIRIQPQ